MPLDNPYLYREGARAFKDALQILAHNTWTAVILDNERYDTDTIHDNVFNNTRLTCRTAGKYIISGTVIYDGHATGMRALSIKLNGITHIAHSRQVGLAVDACAICISTVYDLAVTDYVEMIVYQNSGGNLNLGKVANYSPEFMMQRIG